MTASVEEVRGGGGGGRWVAAAVAILLLFIASAAFVAYTTNKNNKDRAISAPPAAGPPAPPAAGSDGRIASISAQNKLLSYNVSANAAQIRALMTDLAGIRGSALASLRQEVSTYAVSQSALYGQLKKWSDTEFAGSAVAKLLNRVDALGSGKQLISAQASPQRVNNGQSVVFNKIVYNSNSIQNAIALDPASGDKVALQPGSYFITYSLTASPDASWSFVNDGRPVPGSELLLPVHESTAFVIEVRKEAGTLEFSLQTATPGAFDVAFASFIIFAI